MTKTPAELDPAPPGLSAEMRYVLAEIRRDYNAKHSENQEHLEALDRELKAVSAMVKTAFPGGDLDGHRRYHELLIEREQQLQVIRREVITHLLKTSTWLAFAGLAWLCLKQLKDFFIR
jgi:hypothetical protein